MVERVFYSDHPPRADYRLTQKGRAFVPVLVALKDYGEKWEPRRIASVGPSGAPEALS